MMRFLQISLILLLVSSCGSPKLNGYRKEPPALKQITNEYFSDQRRDYIYKAKIRVFKKQFGGLLIIKKTGENRFRFVMTTEFGNKLIDFELDKELFTLHFVIDELNKKFLLRTLRDDFRILTLEDLSVIRQFTDANNRVFTTKISGKKTYYRFSYPEGVLTRILRPGTGKNRLQIVFDKTESRLAREIRIGHPNIKLNIDLKYIGE